MFVAEWDDVFMCTGFGEAFGVVEFLGRVFAGWDCTFAVEFLLKHSFLLG